MLIVVAPAAIAASIRRHRKSGSERPASSGENSTLSVYPRAQPIALTACSSTCSGVMRSFICMWIGELAMNVWMRIERAGFNASPARRTSFSLARASPQTVLSVIARAMSCTASKSPFDEAGKPASITSTRSRSSCRAMRSFSSFVIDAPGLCSPSRNVVSKMIKCSAMASSVAFESGRDADRRLDRERALRDAAVHRRDDRPQRRGDDVGIEPDTVHALRAGAKLDVRDRRRVLAAAGRVLVIGEHVHVEAEPVAQRVDERVDGAVAGAGKERLHAVNRQPRGELLDATVRRVARPMIDVR